jgi:lipoyl-dependent peroxiredoxin
MQRPVLSHPEEILGAAHASCVAMALSLVLGRAGFTRDYVDATVYVTVTSRDGGPNQQEPYRLQRQLAWCHSRDLRAAEAAKTGLPGSQALAGTEITVEATLAAA